MKTVLCYSGGLDSTVLLYHLLTEGHEVRCLGVDYGQRHRRELEAAASVCKLARVEHRIANMRAVSPLLAGSSQTSLGIKVPDGHYEAETMKATVVPNRNMLLLALAGAWAVSTKSDAVAYGAHTGDNAQYADCRPAFAEAMEDALRLCDYREIKMLRPFLYPKPMSKADVVRLGMEIGAPLSLTWSCYKGGERHCGRCGTCVERRESFTIAGATDPTEYADLAFYRQLQKEGTVK